MKRKENDKIKRDTDLRAQSKSFEVLNQVGEERESLSLLKESLTS